MSQWTHVIGAIRLDSVRNNHIKKFDFNEVFKTWNSDWLHNVDLTSPEVKKRRRLEIEQCNVPAGSESSLQFHVWENPNIEVFPAYNILIWGDLRDFGSEKDIETIKDWWENILNYFKNHKNFSGVRQAFLKIEIDGLSIVFD